MLKRFRFTIAILAIVAITVSLGSCGISSSPTPDSTDGTTPTPVSTSSPAGGTEYWQATVTHVFDGDTIQLDNGLKAHYLGIAAPKQGERGYRDATELNKSLVLNKPVQLEVDSWQPYDSSGQVLAYVWIDEQVINYSLVRGGLARSSPDPTHDKWDGLLSQGESEAKAEGVGIWGPARRLDNGTFVQDSGRDGMGELTIENGRDMDTVAVITTLDKVSLFSVYVRAGEQFTVTGIRDGTYYLYVTSGEDWDSESAKFTENRTNFRFEDTMSFETTATQYSIVRAKLQPVLGGNAPTQPVGEGEFPTVQ